MATKLVHLKKQNGQSFYVTKIAFESTIKTDKNWRKHYDYCGEVDEEEVGAKSESAMTSKPVQDKPKEKPAVNEPEETTDEIFNSKNINDGNEQPTQPEKQVSEQPGKRKYNKRG